LKRLAPPKNILRLYKKYFAAYCGKIKFFRSAFSTILRSKIVENAHLKNILWRCKPPKDAPEAFTQPRIRFTQL